MQIKAGSTLYPFPTRQLTLGEQRRLKHEYGFVPGRDEFDLQDPDHLSAFVFAAIREAEQDAPANQIIARIDRLREIEIVDDDGKPLKDGELADVDVPDPTPPATTPAVTPAGDDAADTSGE